MPTDVHDRDRRLEAFSSRCLASAVTMYLRSEHRFRRARTAVYLTPPIGRQGFVRRTTSVSFLYENPHEV
jgi:hypothetical protein